MLYKRRMAGFRRILRLVCGYTLLVIGIIGLFLPFIQGILLIIAGAAVLGWDLSFLKKIRKRLAFWRKS